MDGTGAAFYLKPGLDLDKYIVYLEGGYWRAQKRRRA